MAFQGKWRNPSGTRTYYAWRNARDRCLNPNAASYHNYGGRGISICERWANDYDAFFDDMGPVPDGLTLDRIDVNGHYEPGNCRWTDWQTQSNNRRTNRFITHNGETRTLKQWAEHLGIGTDTLFRRLNVYKMPPERALTPKSLGQTWSHGTRHGYDRGCRCDKCKEAHAARHRAMRARRKSRHEAALACELAAEGKA